MHAQCASYTRKQERESPVRTAGARAENAYGLERARAGVTTLPGRIGAHGKERKEKQRKIPLKKSISSKRLEENIPEPFSVPC